MVNLMKLFWYCISFYFFINFIKHEKSILEKRNLAEIKIIQF